MAGTQRQAMEWTPERIASVGRNTAIVVGVAIALAVFAVAANLYYVAALIAAGVLAIVVAWQFDAALVLYALVAFIPWGRTPDLAMGGSGMGKGIYVSQIMLGFLVVIWIGRYLIGVLPKERVRSGFYAPMWLYLAYSVLCVVNSFIFWDPHVNPAYQRVEVNFIELGLRFLSMAALGMVATSISSPKWLKWVSIFIMIPGLYNLANALAGTPLPVQAPWWPLVALTPICFCLALVFDNTRSIALRVASAAVVVASIYAILVVSIAWVSGWLALLVALGTVLAMRSRRWFVIAAIVAVAAVLIFNSFFHENVVVESKEGGDYDRFALMKGGIKYAVHFPLGVGPGNYRTYNSFYYGEKWGTTSYTSAHGTYAQHLAEMGFPGTVLFVGILVGGFVWLLRSYRKMRPGTSKLVVLAVLGQMAGISVAAAVGDYIIPTYHNGGLGTFSATIYSWLAWGLAIAHVRLDASSCPEDLAMNPGRGS